MPPTKEVERTDENVEKAGVTVTETTESASKSWFGGIWEWWNRPKAEKPPKKDDESISVRERLSALIPAKMKKFSKVMALSWVQTIICVVLPLLIYFTGMSVSVKFGAAILVLAVLIEGSPRESSIVAFLTLVSFGIEDLPGMAFETSYTWFKVSQVVLVATIVIDLLFNGYQLAFEDE